VTVTWQAQQPSVSPLFLSIKTMTLLTVVKAANTKSRNFKITPLLVQAAIHAKFYLADEVPFSVEFVCCDLTICYSGKTVVVTYGMHLAMIFGSCCSIRQVAPPCSGAQSELCCAGRVHYTHAAVKVSDDLARSSAQ